MTENPFEGPEESVSHLAQLIMMLATSAMQHLGKAPMPDGTQIPVDLESAQFSIDLLDTLATKTQGNLDEREEKLMGDSLSALRMLYVQTLQEGGGVAPGAEPIHPPSGDEPASSAEPPSGGEPAAGDNEGGEGDEPKARFKKTYD